MRMRFKRLMKKLSPLDASVTGAAMAQLSLVFMNKGYCVGRD